MPPASPDTAAARSRGADPQATRRLLRLSYVGFISLGLPDTVLGAAWPTMRAELQLPLDAAGALLLLATVGVVIASSASTWLRARWGTGAVLVGSTWLAGAALIATGLARSGGQLLAAALVAGLGGGAIDASLNDHVARHHEARHLSWLHACWGIGAALAPLAVAAVLATGASWRIAYGVLASVEVLLSLAFLRTAGQWRALAAPAQHAHADGRLTLRWPLVASVLLFYLYGGLEAGTGLWTSSLLIETRGLSPARAGGAVALFWGALTLGRIVFGLRADSIGPVRVLRFSCYGALGACVVLALPGTPSFVALVAIAALGLSLAPIYPMAMHDTPSRFGEPWGTRLVGYQVAAASLGIATLPWLLGTIAKRSALSVLPMLLVLLALCLIVLQHARRASSARTAGE